MNVSWLIGGIMSYADILVPAAGVVIGLGVAGKLIVIMCNRRWLKTRITEWLEITPPATIAKTPEATEQLFSVIHGNYSARHMKDRFLGRTPVMSFEITSTRSMGVRYLVQVEQSQSLGLQKAITAYIPDAKVVVAGQGQQETSRVIEFKQDRHYVFPLTLTSASAQHDLLSYVTSAMTKLSDNEQITLQLVLSPVKLREADRLSHRMLSNEDILGTVGSGGFLFLSRISSVMNNILMGLADLTGEAYRGTTTSYSNSSHNPQDSTFQTQVLKRQRPARTLSAFELELMQSMRQKVTQPLFRVNLRILVSGERPKEHLAALRSALDSYSVPPYQSLKTRIHLPLLEYYRTSLAAKRLPSLMHRSSLILSASEVASLYHFPSSRISRTDNLITSLSRTLPAPISLKSGRDLAVLIGENQHHGITTPIGLTEAERERHMYVVGGTGNGKTTILQYMIVQDIQNGKGVAVIDPHGDMAQEIISRIPEERIKDVVYFNPDDLSYPIGLNLLELDDTLEGDDLLREKDLITESVVSIFRKIFSDDDSGGHRIEYILRNATQTALTVKDSTLFTIYDLLNDGRYRRKVITKLEDENLQKFWRNEFGRAGSYQQVKMAAGITAKVGRFLFSASAKRILEQPTSTINFDSIMDESKILICNFSKGLIGEDTSELLGTAVLAKLQLASLRRARVSQAERKPFYLYVDEFQNFATVSFVQMLSESRKYKLFLTMAEQSTSQQADKDMVNIILANVGTVVTFRTGNPADEKILLPLFSPYLDEGEIMNLASFHFYMRLAAVHSQEPLSGATVLLEDVGSHKITSLVIESSRHTYATKMQEIPTIDLKEAKVTADITVESKPQTRKNSCKQSHLSVKSIKPIGS
jgi:hypothetical protein